MNKIKRSPGTAEQRGQKKKSKRWRQFYKYKMVKNRK